MNNEHLTKNNFKIGMFLVLILFVLISLSIFSPIVKRNNLLTDMKVSENQRFWQYQCFDTMKTSRDKARAWKDDKDLDKKINQEMDAIVDLGGNCVAIATPYDEEFLPYLKKWVKSARAHNLAIWYRGNFSSWEGWFDYPKEMRADEHHKKTKEFIEKNADLFEDGDIFTPSPEAENGGPFNQVEQDEHQSYRDYLIAEYIGAKESFEKINKKVGVNWLSMNGGLAKRMFDQKTIDSIGGVVTIDHYIKTAPEMGEFISFFENKFNAKLVIGEFGAPIPDINGEMNEEQQAAFIKQLFEELVKHKKSVYAVNYWTVWDGSAALYNHDWTPRKAVDIVRSFMKPGMIYGKVTSTVDEPLADVLIETGDKKYQTKSDKEGYFSLLIPEGNYTLHIIHPDFTEQFDTVTIQLSTKEQKVYALIPKDPSLLYQFKTTIKDFRNTIF